ncbi:MAG: diguanylate cyclase domain-containing protein [Oscillospiraceae bacterium]
MNDSHFSAQLAMLRTTLQFIQKHLEIFTVVFDTENHIVYRDFGENGENSCPMFASTEGWERFKGLLALSAVERIGSVDDRMGSCFYSFVPIAGREGVKCVFCFIQNEARYQKTRRFMRMCARRSFPVLGCFCRGWPAESGCSTMRCSRTPIRGGGCSIRNRRRQKLTEILWGLAREIERDEYGWKKQAYVNLKEQYLIVIDPYAQEVLYFNAAVGRYFPARHVGKSCKDFFKPCNGRCEQCAIGSLREIGESLEERRIAQDGTVFSLRYKLVQWYDGRSVCLVRGEDLTDSGLRRKVDGDLIYQDQQLGILNRLCLMESLQDTFQSDSKFGTLLLVDLDKFRIFNESFGHACGDEALAAIVQYLKDLFPSRPVFRFEGDQFVVVLRSMPVEEAEIFVRRILERFTQPWELSTVTCTCKVNIGLATYGDEDTDIDRTLNHLGYALMEAKHDRYRAYVVFDEALQKKVERNRKIRSCVIRAAEQDAFTLFFQPIYDVQAACKHRASAAARGRPEIGGISQRKPAEEMGLITKIGYRVLDRLPALSEAAAGKRRNQPHCNQSVGRPGAPAGVCGGGAENNWPLWNRTVGVCL